MDFGFPFFLETKMNMIISNAIRDSNHKPKPIKIPRAAVDQTAEAVVRPFVCPFSALQMTPKPRKPIPLTI